MNTSYMQASLLLAACAVNFCSLLFEFLGVILSEGAVQMDPAKLKGIADWATPKCVKDVRAFLGFTGFYRYFVPNYSRIARPLIQLTQKNTPFHWWEPHFKAFETHPFGSLYNA